MARSWLPALLAFCAASCGLGRGAAAETFTNPLLPSGPDPWVIYRNGFYYYTNTLGDRIALWRTRDITRLRTAEMRVIWRPPATGPDSASIWAPELHWIRGGWYLYFAASDRAHNDDAHACWSDQYALGMLTAAPGANLLDPRSWTKSPAPVFHASVANGVYATGHNGFFKSPDGREDWIIYHANSGANEGCGKNRSPRIQPFTWKPDGTPDFGIPVPTSLALRAPSNASPASK